MKYTSKLIILLVFISLATPFSRVWAVTMSELMGRGSVLGASTTSVFPYPSGSLVNDGGTIYFISGTTKIAFTNYKAFTGLGYSLKNVIKGSLSNYTPSPTYSISTANAEHPWDSWLSYGGTVYYVAEQGLIGVPSAAIFTANGGNWAMLVKANKYDIAVLDAAPKLAALTMADPRVLAAPNIAEQPQAGLPAPTPTPNPAAAVEPGVPGTLNSPQLANTSPPNQFMIGGDNNQLAVTFNFSATGSPVTIQEMDIAVIYSDTLPFPPVSTISAGGIPATLIDGTSYITGLNITVPNTAGGVNVPVLVNCQPANPTNIPAGQTFTLELVGLKYSSQGVTTSVPLSLSSNSISLVDGYPTVSLSNSGQQLSDNLLLVAKLTVGANSGGSIILNQVPIIFSSTGTTSIPSMAGNLTVTDDGSGAPVQVSYNTFGLEGGGTVGVTLTFNSDNVISGNASKTYDLYLTPEYTYGAPGTSSLTTSLGSSGSFVYTDVNADNASVAGGSGDATYIANYPTTGVTIHN